jgi:hypothetical protein
MPMRTQEQAFRAYYGSMTDSELLTIAKNQSSFIPIAQMLLAEELARRQLTPPADAPTETGHSPTLFRKIRAMLRHRSARRSDRAKTV